MQMVLRPDREHSDDGVNGSGHVFGSRSTTGAPDDGAFGRVPLRCHRVSEPNQPSGGIIGGEGRVAEHRGDCPAHPFTRADGDLGLADGRK